MDAFEQDDTSGVLESAMPPCISIYQPTHRRHPENQQDAIRFRNLLKEAQASLQQQHAAAVIDSMLAPFRALADDAAFWNTTRDGLAVLGSRDLFRVYRLQRTVESLVVVSDSFHTKPLAKLMQSSQRYQILGLSRKSVRLFEGDRDTLDEVELAPGVARSLEDALGTELTSSHSNIGTYGSFGSGNAAMHHGQGGRSDEVDKDDERFFRVVDRDIQEHHSPQPGVPLILATLPEHRDGFHRVSHNTQLLERGIDVSPDAVSLDELRKRAWQVVEPFYTERLKAQLEQFGTARANGLGGETLQTVAEAVVTGRVATLLIDADRVVPGHVDSETGAVILADLARPDVDDVLDDLASMARRRGGKVFVVPGDQLPVESGVAAIYRY
jgi:hypothetical protein